MSTRRTLPTPHKDFACDAPWYRPQNFGAVPEDWPHEARQEAEVGFTLVVRPTVQPVKTPAEVADRPAPVARHKRISQEERLAEQRRAMDERYAARYERAQAIRHWYAQGVDSQAEIARVFGVTQAYVSLVVRNQILFSPERHPRPTVDAAEVAA